MIEELAVNAAFNSVLAVDGLYTPAGGVEIPVRIMRNNPDAVRDLQEGRILGPQRLFDIRVSEVASPKAGDTFVIGAEAFKVEGKPARNDSHRLIWSLEASPL